jgi:hypothetical protein
MGTGTAVTHEWMIVLDDGPFVYHLQRVQNTLLGGNISHVHLCEYLQLWLQILLDILFMEEV